MKQIPEIQLLQDYILVKKISSREAEEEAMKRVGLVAPQGMGDKERSAKGIVMKTAENCKICKPKQKIIFFMYAPIEITIDEDKFLILSEQDVLAIMGEID